MNNLVSNVAIIGDGRMNYNQSRWIFLCNRPTLAAFLESIIVRSASQIAPPRI